MPAGYCLYQQSQHNHQNIPKDWPKKMMASTVPTDRCGSADTAKSEDPLDGKPSEDARLTHVDSCSSLPEAGDDLVPCSRRNSSQPNQQYGRDEEFGSETLKHLLANASTLLTAQDLELSPNDPRALLPTPFAPGQSARTLSEQELKRKREQENKEWHAWRSKTTLPSERADPKRDLPLGRGRARPLPTRRGRARSNESSAGDPLFQQQRQPQQPLLQQQQQQHLLNPPRQLSGGLLNRQQISPMQLMYPPNAAPMAFQQPARMGVGASVGLRQLDAFGGNASNNLMLPNNFASAFALAANNGIDRAGLNKSFTENRNGINNANTPMMQESTKTATRRVDMGSFGENNVSDKSRSQRWTQRYNELLEFKRVEGHCRVPHGYPPNKKLSWWVMNQRAQYAQRASGKKTWLTEDRIKLLDKIGFVWNPNAKKQSKAS